MKCFEDSKPEDKSLKKEQEGKEEEEEAKDAAPVPSKAKEPQPDSGKTSKAAVPRQPGAIKALKGLKHSASTSELSYASSRGADEAEFLARIEGAFAKVLEARKLSVSERQLYHCLGVLEHLRRRKAIALVGPVCSGKT